MEAICSSESQWTAQHYIPEDGTLLYLLVPSFAYLLLESGTVLPKKESAERISLFQFCLLQCSVFSLIFRN
jgi:hypothetical protein